MARAEVASASVSSDSIKGLAQSIAKPAYRRLLTAEPALRRAVPALIIAFLVTICIGAFVQVFDHRRQAIGEIVRGMTGSAEFLADRFGRLKASDDRRKQTALTVTLSATTGFVVLILGFAFHWQATRAREADMIYETVRTRIDTALNRGRCGLWDWELGRGRIFWSHSMFAILGLKPKDELMSFGEVNALVHPDDLHLYQLAAEL